MKLTLINLNSPPFLHIKIKESLPLTKTKKQKQLKFSNRETKKRTGCAICIIVCMRHSLTDGVSCMQSFQAACEATLTGLKGDNGIKSQKSITICFHISIACNVTF